MAQWQPLSLQTTHPQKVSTIMLRSLIWSGTTWLFGTALILGSCMTVGSLLLWLIPTPPTAQPTALRHRLRLTLVAASLAIAGIIGLLSVPFPG